MKAEEFVHQGVDLGIFEIDRQGRVWRIAHQQTSAWGHETYNVPCKRRRAERGRRQKYWQVSLMLDGRREICGAHRLVYFHFKGAIPNRLTVNHRDGNKKNNQPRNLELATPAQQSQHAMTVLGWKPFSTVKNRAASFGEKNGMAKLTAKVAREIKKSKETGTALALRYKMSPASISRIRNGQAWRAA